MRKSLNVQRFQKYGQLWAGQGGEDVGKCVHTSMRQTSLTCWFYELNANSRHLWFYLLVQYITVLLYIHVALPVSCQAIGKDFISLLLQFMIWNDKKDLLAGLACLIFHAVESSERALAVYPLVWCVPCVAAIAAICCVPAATVCSLFYHSHLNEPHSQLEKGDLTANQPPQQECSVSTCVPVCAPVCCVQDLTLWTDLRHPFEKGRKILAHILLPVLCSFSPASLKLSIKFSNWEGDLCALP